MTEQPFVLRVRLKSVRELEAELAALTERLEIISDIALGGEYITETPETAIKKIGILCPPDLGQPDARWPEIPEEWRRPNA